LFYEAKINCYFSEEILKIFVDIVEKSDLNSSFNFNYIKIGDSNPLNSKNI